MPCTDPNGVAGLYDTFSERFVTPLGGAVVAGEVWQGDVWKPSPTFVHFGGENGMLATTENQAFSSVTANFWVRNAQVRRKSPTAKRLYVDGILRVEDTFVAADSPRMDGMWDNFTFEDGAVEWPKRIGTMLLVR